MWKILKCNCYTKDERQTYQKIKMTRGRQKGEIKVESGW